MFMQVMSVTKWNTAGRKRGKTWNSVKNRADDEDEKT